MYDTELTSNDRSAAFAFKSKSGNEDGITLVLINFDMKNSVEFNINIIGGKSGTTYVSNEYYLRPDGSSLQTQSIYVNNVLMKYKDNTFPTLEPIKGNGQSISLESAGLVFVVLTPQ